MIETAAAPHAANFRDSRTTSRTLAACGGAPAASRPTGYAARVPRAVTVNARARKPAPGRARASASSPDVAAQREARRAEILERDRPLIAEALAWAADAQPGAALSLRDASVLGLEAAADALRAEGFGCEVRGCSLVLVGEA